MGAQVLPKDGAPFLAWHLVLVKPFGSGMQQEQTLHTYNVRARLEMDYGQNYSRILGFDLGYVRVIRAEVLIK